MKTKFIYKKIAPDLEKIKTDSILKICREALEKKQADRVYVLKTTEVKACKKTMGEVYDSNQKRKATVN